jgi:hypothetical protein
MGIKAKDAAGNEFWFRSTKAGTELDPVISQEDISDRLDLVNAVLGTAAAAEATTNTGTFNLVSLVKRLLNTRLAGLPAALGQAASASSLPVVVASDQLSQPVTMTAINLSAVSGDQTIVSPTSNKALRIYNLVLSNPTTLTSFVLKAGTVAQGQVALTSTLSAYDYAGDFSPPLGLPVDRSFVINLPSSGSLTGYVTWREE